MVVSNAAMAWVTKLMDMRKFKGFVLWIISRHDLCHRDVSILCRTTFGLRVFNLGIRFHS